MPEPILRPAARAAHAPNRSRTSDRTTVCVVGLGYVGLPLAIAAEAAGHRIVGIDADAQKIDALTRRDVDYLTEDEQRAFRASRMEVSADPRLIRAADVVFICVPTPVNGDHTPDLGPLTRASETVGEHLGRGTLVVVESTVNPGACEEVVLPILAERSGLTPERDFSFAHCPERINPGDETWTIRTIPRVVGANSSKSLARAREIYESFLSAPVHAMGSIREAEAVKVVENTFRDINIAYVNELAMSFARMGIDVVNVIDAAATKPFGFMPHYPKCGVGGHCIPVDPYYLMEYAARHGFEHRLIKTARSINNHMPTYTVELVQGALARTGRPIEGARIALLGLSYKADVPDLRESPALQIHDELRARGAVVVAHDPYIEAVTGIETLPTLDEALAGADAVVLATNHREFCELAPPVLIAHGIEVIVDGCNCLDKDAFVRAGITYRGIGR